MSKRGRVQRKRWREGKKSEREGEERESERKVEREGGGSRGRDGGREKEK